VLVAEPAEIVSLTVNDTSGIVTLNESADDTLTLSCVARGVPSPPLRLLRVSVARCSTSSSQAVQGKYCRVPPAPFLMLRVSVTRSVPDLRQMLHAPFFLSGISV